jgi:hypothetical protein
VKGHVSDEAGLQRPAGCTFAAHSAAELAGAAGPTLSWLAKQGMYSCTEVSHAGFKVPAQTHHVFYDR